MSEALRPISAFIREHKGKILLVPIFVIAWAVLIFPTGDLAEMVSSQVSQATNDSVMLDMDSVGISLFPVGAKLENVSVEAPGFPPLKVGSLTVSPNIGSALAFKAGGSVAMTEFLGGDADISFSQGAQTKAGRTQEIDATFTGTSLKRAFELVKSMMSFEVGLDGKLKIGRVQASFDPSLERQPTGSFDATISSVKANLSQFITGPDLTFSSISLTGRLAEGHLKIERGELGSAKDELSATIKGNVDLAVVGVPGGAFRAAPGAYELTVSLTASDAMLSRLSLLTSYLDSSRVPPEKAGSVTTYRFKVISGIGPIPRIEPAL